MKGKETAAAETAPATRIYLPSMSKTEDLLACQWPWKRKLPIELFVAGFEARYGSAFHEAMASVLVDTKEPVKWKALAKKWGVEGDVDAAALKAHVKRAKEVLVAWLRGGNPWKVDLAKRAKFRAEQSVAWNALKKTARGIKGPQGVAHIYEGISADEFPGSGDLVIDEIETKKDCPDLIVLDHKSGEGYIALPHTSGQMRSLGLAFGKRVGAKRIAAVIFHAPREDSVAPTIYADEFEREELKAHASELKRAWQRIGDGTLRPGDHCSRCIAQSICPAWRNALAKMETASTEIELTPERVGQLQLLTSQAIALAEKIRRDQLRPWLEKGGIGEREDGKLVVLKPKKVRNLSMASIERALGPAEAAKKIAELDAQGLIETRTDWSITAVNDDRG